LAAHAAQQTLSLPLFPPTTAARSFPARAVAFSRGRSFPPLSRTVARSLRQVFARSPSRAVARSLLIPCSLVLGLVPRRSGICAPPLPHSLLPRSRLPVPPPASSLFRHPPGICATRLLPVPRRSGICAPPPCSATRQVTHAALPCAQRARKLPRRRQWRKEMEVAPRLHFPSSVHGPRPPCLPQIRLRIIRPPLRMASVAVLCSRQRRVQAQLL
jgi:hypothetical protein